MIGYEHRSYFSHFGAILSNFSIVLLMLSVIGLLFTIASWMLPVVLLFGWLIAIVFSVGMLLLNEKFRSFPETALRSMEFIGVIDEYIWTCMPYVFFGGLICGALSIVFVLLDPSPRKSYWRVGLAVAVLLLFLLVGGGLLATLADTAKGGA